MNVTNRVQQLFAVGVLGQVRHSPVADSTIDVFAAPIVGENNDARAGKFHAKSTDHVETADLGQTEVEDHDIRIELSIHSDAGFSIACLADYLDLCIACRGPIAGPRGQGSGLLSGGLGSASCSDPSHWRILVLDGWPQRLNGNSNRDLSTCSKLGLQAEGASKL